jgi:hypothetical protein
MVLRITISHEDNHLKDIAWRISLERIIAWRISLGKKNHRLKVSLGKIIA